jgi:quercetin dioxygenase-like cupin family protein
VIAVRIPLVFCSGVAALAGLCAGLALGQGDTGVGHPIPFAGVVRGHPIDPQTGATITPVARGELATANVWQLTARIPAHFHRSHEEVIFVQSGTGTVRVGDQTFALQTGDLLLVPQNVVHSVQATGERPFRGVSVFGPAFDGQDRVFVEEKP